MSNLAALELLIFEVFAGLALSEQIAFRQRFKFPIDWVGRGGNALVCLSGILHNTLNIGIAPRFFYIVGKMVVGHFGINHVFLHQISDILKIPYVLFDICIFKFAASIFHQCMGRIIVLNFICYFCVSILDECIPQL